jgi:hypothetical protein
MLLAKHVRGCQSWAGRRIGWIRNDPSRQHITHILSRHAWEALGVALFANDFQHERAIAEVVDDRSLRAAWHFGVVNDHFDNI